MDVRTNRARTVFASTVGKAADGGYGVANSTVARVLAVAQSRAAEGVEASTEGCAEG